MKHPDRRRVFRNKALALCLSAAWLFLAAFTFQGDDASSFQRGLASLTRVYSGIGAGYATEVDAIKLMRAGVRGMLSELDPYSAYIDEQDKADVEMLTTGSYGGIGISVGKRGSRFIVTDLVEDRPGSATEPMIGDEILEVDTTKISSDLSDMRSLLRGAAGSVVRLKIRRPGTAGVLDLAVTRRDIPVRTVSLAGEADPGILYIKLDRFTRAAAARAREALQPFLSQPLQRGVIIDLRDNPGGLLESAVDVLSLFLPQGAVTVSTRGRQRYEITSRVYRCTEHPLAAELPVVVLVNSASASASEILAGAIQDHDRGVIVGTRTFGKGLVQSVLPIDEHRSIKLTTSTYYTPAGRCIQKPFKPKNAESALAASTCADSSLFRSLVRGRALHASGGIEPDVTVQPDTGSPFMRALRSNGAIITFAAACINRDGISKLPEMDEPMRRAFATHVDTLSGLGNTDAETHAERLADALAAEGYPKKLIQQTKELRTILQSSRPDRVSAEWPVIREELLAEFVRQLLGRKARFEIRKNSDAALVRAIALLKDPAAFQLALETEH